MTHREIWLSRKVRTILAEHGETADVLARIMRSSATVVVNRSLPLRGKDGGMYEEIREVSGYDRLIVVWLRGVTIIQLER